MASMWLNGFRPQTQIGGLQGFVNALFDGETPNQAEDRALKAAQMRAQTRQLDASAGKLGSEAALLDDRLAALQDPESWVSAITGQPLDRVRAVREHLGGGVDNRVDFPEWAKKGPVTPDTTAMSMPEIGPMGVAAPQYDPDAYDMNGRPIAPPRPLPPMPGAPALATPSVLSERGAAESRLIAEALATALATRQTQTNNPEQIGKTFRAGVKRLTTEDILRGILPADVGARRVAATDGKPLVNINAAGQVIDNFSGAAGPSNPLVESSIGENRAQERKFNAGAAADEFIDVMVGGQKVQVPRGKWGEAAAEARWRAPQRAGGGAKEDPLIEVEIPGRGKVKMLQSKYSEAMGRILSREDQQPVRLGAEDIKNIQGTGAAILDQLEATQDGKLPPEFRNAVIARAIELAGTPDYARNPNFAVQAAIEELAPDGFDMDSNWFSPNNLTPRGGARTPAPRATQPAAPRIPAAPATDMSGRPGGARPKVARPAGATDAQLMQEANDAIRKGAPRDAVIQRLRDMGVEVQ
jgi:hypothetical protein